MIMPRNDATIIFAGIEVPGKDLRMHPMKPYVPFSYRKCLAAGFAALTVGSGLLATPASAGGSDLAVGLLGGLAAGTVVGSAIAQPRYYYYPPYYAPAPVYAPAPACWYERRSVWDGYGYVIQPVRVCQ
jgi:hypothetical protein